jgi:hypothetical protein
MNTELFKIKILNNEKYLPDKSNDITNELFPINEINLVIDKNSDIIKKCDFERLIKINIENKDKDKLKRKNPYSFENNPKLIKKIDPEKKPYLRMNIKQIEEQIEKYKILLDEMKNNSNKKEEINKYIRLSDKWLKITHDAIYTILEIHPQNNMCEKNTIKSVLNHFKIDKDLIKYNSDEDCFE